MSENNPLDLQCWFAAMDLHRLALDEAERAINPNYRAYYEREAEKWRKNAEMIASTPSSSKDK